MESGLSNFFAQMPPILYFAFCGSGIAMLGVIGYTIFTRRRRAATPLPMSMAFGGGDMPDLDMLLGSSLPASAPAPMPQAQAAAPPAPRPARSGTVSVALEEGGRVEAVEIVTILRDIVDGGLIVQIGEKAYRHPPTSADAEFKRRLANTLRELTGSTRSTGTTPAVVAPLSPAPVMETIAPSRPVISSPAAEVRPDANVVISPSPLEAAPPTTQVDAGAIIDAYGDSMRSAVSSSPSSENESRNDTMLDRMIEDQMDSDDLPEPPDLDLLASLPPLQPLPPRLASAPPTLNRAGALPGDLPNFKITDNPLPPMKRGRRPPRPTEAIPELNIALAIEAFLQHKLQDTRAYPGRSIHVSPAMGGGVTIEVDGTLYEAVADVRDAEIRDFLTQTIQEWQARQG